MIIRAAVAFGFPVKIPVFDVQSHGQPHIGIGGQLFAARTFGGRTAEIKNRRVPAFDHFGAQFDFNRASIPGIGDKLPGGRRAGLKRSKIFCVKRRKKSVGVDPGADAFDKNMAVHRDARIQVRAEDAVVFGIHAAQIHADARHAADAVGQQDQV